MTPDEQQMISALFERIGNVGRVDKDYDAEKLIKDQVRRLPDAPYMLVQSVLVQEEALTQADARIQDLESQLAQLLPPDRQRGSGSFLRRGAGSRGGEQPPFVPPTPGMRPPGGTQSPWGAQPADQAPPQRGGGGFLASALSTAAGVTGGMLAAESLRGLFGGGGGGLFGGPAHADGSALQNAQDRAQDAEQDLGEAQTDLAADDAASDEQQDDNDQDNSDDGGGDDGGGIDV